MEWYIWSPAVPRNGVGFGGKGATCLSGRQWSKATSGDGMSRRTFRKKHGPQGWGQTGRPPGDV